MQYIINIDDDSEDRFEEFGDNVAKVLVLNAAGEDISSETFVNLFLTSNAMLGLGTELIRLAHTFHPGKHSHLEPCTESLKVQRMGVFLQPGSAKTTILCDASACIDDF